MPVEGHLYPRAMRIGVAIDLHAVASSAVEVTWRNTCEAVRTAEQLGFDLVVLPDHLSYRANGEGDYVSPDEPVGVRESMSVAAALAAVTSRIVIGHSVVNAPYRTPTMLAHIAATLTDISEGRYSLGIGVGNSFDYDQLGVPADQRVGRFEECVEVVAGLLRNGHADLDGTYWSASDAELAFVPTPGQRPPIVVAAGGPRTMSVAARFGDAWNGFTPTDPASPVPADLLRLLDRTCDEVGRDPSSIERTVDLAVDAMDLRGARGRSVDMLGLLEELGVDEVRCYTLSEESHRSRVEAITALGELVGEI